MSSLELEIESLYDLAERSPSIPFTNSVRIDKDELFRILAELKRIMPEEINDAKSIVRDCEQYIENAKNEANSIIKQAEFEASKLTSEHEIYRQAVEEGERVKAKAAQDADEGLMEVTRYIDKLLEEAGNAAEEAHQLMMEQQNKINQNYSMAADMLLKVREDLRGN